MCSRSSRPGEPRARARRATPRVTAAPRLLPLSSRGRQRRPEVAVGSSQLLEPSVQAPEAPGLDPDMVGTKSDSSTAAQRGDVLLVDIGDDSLVAAFPRDEEQL